MLILLPPSETKTRPASHPVSGHPASGWTLEELSRPELSSARETMLRAVRRTAAASDAAARLGVPASAPGLVDRMAQLEQEPVAPALEVYSGVLFDQLAQDAVVPEDRQVLIQSALLGLVDAGTDRIPAYRVSATSQVQRLGKVGSWWRKHLAPTASALHDQLAASPSPLVIDCRSGAYRSMMPMRSTPQVRVLEVAPVQERDGVRKVISHDAKRHRGWVTRVLLDAPRPPADAEAAATLLRTGFDGTLEVEVDGDRLVIVDRVA